jgi:hypothetical protein
MKNHARFALLAFVANSMLGSCTSDENTQTAAVVTLFDIQAQMAAGRRVIAPINLPMAGRFTYTNEALSIDVSPAFSDGLSAAYITTEYWEGFSKVWVQPMYVMVKAPLGKMDPIAGVLPIFSVGPDSAFYSPYWRVFFVVVPDLAPVPEFRTTTDVLNSGYRLIPGPARLCSLAPTGTDITAKRAGMPPLHPLTAQETVGPTVTTAGWVDGYAKPVSVVSSGDDRFTYNAQGVVDESPLYVFRRQSDGPTGPKIAGLPSVGGRDASGKPRGSAAPDNRPAFGSHWRLHFVDLPATAGVMVPTDPTPKQMAKIHGIQVAGLKALPIDMGDAGRDIFFRPVLDAETCRIRIEKAQGTIEGIRTPLLSLCRFLDSESKIQEFLPPEKIVRSDVLATCPWVTYRGQAVPLEPVAESRP